MSIKSGLNVNKYDTVWETICRRVSFLRAIVLSSLGTCPPGNKRLLQLVMQLLPSGYPVTKLPKKRVSKVISAFKRLFYWVISNVTNTSFNKLHVQFCHVSILLCSSSLYPWTCTCLKYVQIVHVAVPLYPWRIGSRTPPDTEVQECSNPLYKMGQYLHITYTHPPIYLKSFLGLLTATDTMLMLCK